MRVGECQSIGEIFRLLHAHEIALKQTRVMARLKAATMALTTSSVSVAVVCQGFEPLDRRLAHRPLGMGCGD
jgi:hypothetical protein